jgi:hypothetical protein
MTHRNKLRQTVWEFSGARRSAPLDRRTTWLGGAQEEPTLNSSPTSPGMESLRRIELPMYASFTVFIPRRTPLTLAQAMSRIDRANFVLRTSQAYDDSPQYVEFFLCPVG